MSDEIRYGGFWRRFFALIVDTIIWYSFFFCFLLLVIPAGFIYLTETGGILAHFPEFESILPGIAAGEHYTYHAPTLVNMAVGLIFYLMLIGYFAGMESSSRQATYGKMMFGLKVTDEHVFRIGFWHSFGRYMAKALSVLTIFIGFLMAAFTEKKQSLHDIVCKTLVIRDGSCFIWPAFKVILLSILFTILVFVGAGAYTYTKYGNIFSGETEARKKIGVRIVTDFFGVDIFSPDKLAALDILAEGNKQKESTSTDDASNFVPTDTPLEKREDGLIYKINEDSPYTGENYNYYESGKKKEEGYVLEGQFHGSVTIWHENGKIKEKTNYEKGVLNGAYTTWDENGNKEQEANFLKNEFEGPYILYFENGQKSQTGNYKEGGLLHGQIIYWDEEGNFTKSQTYENGELLETSTTPPENLSEVADSLSTDLQDNEALTSTKEKFDLENNNNAATFNVQLKESFHDNGQKKMEAHYVDGKLNGSSTLWNKNGQKIITVNYKENNRHGLLTRWHNNGQKKIEINYTDNKRDGEMTFWNENGDIKKTLTYVNGKIVKKESPQINNEETPSNSGNETKKNNREADTAQQINKDIKFPEPPEVSFNFGTSVTAGPSVLGYLKTNKSSVNLIAYTSLIPQLSQPKVLIDVDTVLDIDNMNYYDPTKNSKPCCGLKKKQPREARLLIANEDEPTPHHSSSWKIYLNKNLTNDKLLSVSGNVIILIPETTEIATFFSDEIAAEGIENPLSIGKKQKTIDKTVAGNLVSLIGFEKTKSYVHPNDDYKITILFDVDLKEDVAMFAYNVNGDVIQRNDFPYGKGMGMQKKEACIIWNSDGTNKKDFCTREGERLDMSYPQKPAKIEVHISKMIIQKFPFTLTK